MINTVLQNIEPNKKVTNRVVRGRKLQVPQEITAAQKSKIASKLIVKATRDLRKEKGISSSAALSDIIINSFNNTGKAIELKKSLEAAAEVNKAYKV